MENIEEHIAQILAGEDTDDLEHAGIKGMKWGIRRFQNKDGSLTPAGQKRYNKTVGRLEKQNAKLEAKINKKKVRDEAESKINKLLAERDSKKKALKGESYSDDDASTKSEKKSAVIRDNTVTKKNNGGSTKRIKDMTDAELNAVINRINLETKYMELTNPKNKTNGSKAKKFVGEVLEKSTKNIATQVTTYALGTATNKVIEAIWGEAHANAINPKKGQKDK